MKYTAWCHTCSIDFVYYDNTKDEKPNYICPNCNTNDYVTVP